MGERERSGKQQIGAERRKKGKRIECGPYECSHVSGEGPAAAAEPAFAFFTALPASRKYGHPTQ